MPIRIALTGQMAGPDVADLLAVLDKAVDGEVKVEGYLPLEQRMAALRECLSSS
jgi:hypothetical protein